MDPREVEDFMAFDEPPEDPVSPRPSVLRWLAETIVLVVVAFALAQGVKTFVVQPYLVPTGSMIPTIEIGERVFAEKITYRLIHPPEPGDVVVFSDPTGEHPQLIKRVIAVGGQTIELRDSIVLVDGKELDEPYTDGGPTTPGTVDTPFLVPKGHVWLMGDNRRNSADSRFFGPSPVSSVRGRAFWTYWPLTEFGRLDR